MVSAEQTAACLPSVITLGLQAAFSPLTTGARLLLLHWVEDSVLYVYEKRTLLLSLFIHTFKVVNIALI